MLMGCKLKANPTREQKRVLSQWMGCARFIWNAKCEENHYLASFAKRYLPLGTLPSVDQTYAQYKTELSSWLSEAPSHESFEIQQLTGIKLIGFHKKNS